MIERSEKSEIDNRKLRLTSHILRVMFILVLAVAGTAHAHLPMETEYAETLPKEGWEFRLHAGYMDMSAEHDDDSTMTEQMYELLIGYGLTKDLSVYIEPSYKVKEMDMPHGGMHLMKEDSSGIGDTEVLARYRFLKKDRENGSFQEAIVLGVKLPTGAWNLEDDGTRLMDMVQPGTGSVDYKGGFAITHRIGNFTLDGDLIYTFKTENPEDYKFGDLLSYDLAGLYQIKDLYLMLEFNGRLASKDEFDGEKIDDTGGHQIFINPGVSYHIVPNVMLMLSVQLPIYADMNGDAQQTNYHAMGGVHWFY